MGENEKSLNSVFVAMKELNKSMDGGEKLITELSGLYDKSLLARKELKEYRKKERKTLRDELEVIEDEVDHIEHLYDEYLDVHK